MVPVSSPELTLVVITHDRADLLDQMLASISEQSWDESSWDVLVVDNASTDHTPAVLGQWADRMPVPMQVVQATDGRGPAYARNTGAGHATAEHLAFVDDDDLLGPGWVAAMGRALDSHPFVASRHDFERLNPREVAASEDANVHCLSEVGETPVATGGGFGCHRGLWHELGGMDEALRYGEDIDFSLRAAEHGVVPTFVPEATYHTRLRTDARAAFDRGRQFGKASVDVYVRHGRGRGQRPDRLGLLLRVWAAYLARIPSLVNPGKRLAYAQQLGRRVGRLQGSLGARVWYP